MHGTVLKGRALFTHLSTDTYAARYADSMLRYNQSRPRARVSIMQFPLISAVQLLILATILVPAAAAAALVSSLQYPQWSLSQYVSFAVALFYCTC